MEKALPQETYSSPPGSDTETASPKTNYGDAEVQFGMGLKFATDTGAAQDYGQAAEWYHKAAEQNHSLAQFNLGVMYAHGQGVTRDAAQSAAWFGKAAKLGDAGAQFHLGDCCQRTSFKQVAGGGLGIKDRSLQMVPPRRRARLQGFGKGLDHPDPQHDAGGCCRRQPARGRI